MTYGPSWYGVLPSTLQAMRQLQPWRPVLQWLCAWAVIYGLVQLAFWNIWLAPVCALFIVGRAGVFLQLVHEATHRSISKREFNDWFGQLCAAGIGLDLKEYRDGHLKHHAYTNATGDPPSDSEKYRICDIRNPALWGLFLKDLLGITATYVRLQYQGNRGSGVEKYVWIGLCQLAILGVLFKFNLLVYVLLWPLPLMTLHMVLMRVRGIGEHGLGKQRHLPEPFDGTRYTRSFGTPHNQYLFRPFVWLERALIGSCNVYYHHEHHLFPSVPYYHLPEIHRLIWKDEQHHQQEVFAKGYVACLWA